MAILIFGAVLCVFLYGIEKELRRIANALYGKSEWSGTTEYKPLSTRSVGDSP